MDPAKTTGPESPQYLKVGERVLSLGHSCLVLRGLGLPGGLAMLELLLLLLLHLLQLLWVQLLLLLMLLRVGRHGPWRHGAAPLSPAGWCRISGL